MPEREPERSQLSRLLKQPAARGRVRSAVVSLLAASVASIAVVGALAIWHLVRRGRMIRQRLAPPRPVRWPPLEPETERAAKPTDEINQDEL
jgi:hypothetical protein